MNKYLQLDLTVLFNHKGIIDSKKQEKILTIANRGIGPFHNYLKASTFPNPLEIINIEGIPFVFPDHDLNKYDNIQCKKQVIEFANDFFSAVHLLGLNIVGNNFGKLKLHFDNDLLEENTFCFLGCDQDGKVVKDNLFKVFDILDFTGKAAIYGKNFSDQICCLSYSKIQIKNRDLKLKAIELPYNSSIHIFSITLER